MISKSIYELLPSVYLMLGSSSLIWNDNSLGLLGGALLFILGAVIWVMRSNYRRTDEHKLPSKSFTLPETLYEFVPFLFIGLGLSLLSQFSQLPIYIVAAVCLYRGTQLLYLRHRHRNFAWDNNNKRKSRSSAHANR